MNPPLSTFLRDLRQGRNLSQTQAARRAGIAKSTVNAWERGKFRPSRALLERYLQALGHRSPCTFATQRLDASHVKDLIAEALRGLRLRSGLNQCTLSQAVYVRQGSVSKWEKQEGKAQIPSDTVFDRLQTPLALVPEEVSLLKQFREVEETALWHSIMKCSFVPSSEELFELIALPAVQEQMNEHAELLKLLLALHAVKYRAQRNPAWRTAHLILANHYCGSLMRAQRNKEMRLFSRNITDRYTHEFYDDLNLQRITTMEILAENRLTLPPPREARRIVTLATHYQDSTRVWLYGIAADIAQRNGDLSTMHHALSQTQTLMLKIENIGGTLGIVSDLLSGSGQHREALTTLDTFWDKHWKSNAQGDPFALYPYLARAKCHFALGDCKTALSILAEMELELQRLEAQTTQPGMFGWIRAKIREMRSHNNY